MGQYSIEARSLSVLGGVASHNFWVLRDDKGKAVAELHGLATDRQTGRAVPIGTDAERHSLRGWHFIHDAKYARDFGSARTDASYIQEGQASIRVLSGSREEILARWKVAARDGVNLLNAQDRDYPNFGVARQAGFDGNYNFRINDSTVNSNSVYSTFGQLMVGASGVPVFRNTLQPGVGNHVLDSNTRLNLQYDRPQFRQGSVEADTVVAGLGVDLGTLRAHPRVVEAGKALADSSGFPQIPAERLEQFTANLAAAGRQPPSTASGADQPSLDRIAAIAMSTNGRDVILSNTTFDRAEGARVTVPFAQLLNQPAESAARTLSNDGATVAQAQTTAPELLARSENTGAPTPRV